MKRHRPWWAASRFHSTTIYIYAYVSPADEVVYIGRTYDPGTRHGAHRQRSPWWTPDLTFAVIETVVGWDAAKAAEAAAIHALAPTHNVMHNRRAA